MNKKLEKIRITGGEYRGREIVVPTVTHAMGSRERLALFNMIGLYLPRASVLDAYAGSGALGIEALSRGAESVLFVDSNSDAARIIRDNLNLLGIPEATWKVVKADVSKMTEGKFNIVLADPPYDKYKPAMILKLAPMVADGGILVASTPEEAPEIAGLKKLKSRQYAAAYISVYHRKD